MDCRKAYHLSRERFNGILERGAPQNPALNYKPVVIVVVSCNMPNRCPHCQKSVASRAIACPHCHTPLKALGHEGIPLYRALGDDVLCDTCTYHQDDSCNYPKRPLAKDCIMYVDIRIPQDPTPLNPTRPSSPWQRFTQWANQNLWLLFLGGLVIISLLMVLSGG